MVDLPQPMNPMSIMLRIGEFEVPGSSVIEVIVEKLITGCDREDGKNQVSWRAGY